MDQPKYEFYLTTEKLVRPIGNIRYVSRPKLYKRMSPNSAPPVPAPIAEMYGATAKEAESKVNEYMRKWIADQSTLQEKPGTIAPDVDAIITP
jgi:hypothetical protein